MWLSAWLMEQSVIISLLVLCLFVTLRHQQALQRIETRIAFIQGLLVIWSSNWGDAPESVRHLLETYLKATQGGHT
jgi:hypothetical protein